MSDFSQKSEKQIEEVSGLKQCKHCEQFLLNLNLSWQIEGYSDILRCHDCNICWGFNRLGSIDVTDYIDLRAEDEEQRHMDKYHDELRKSAKKHLN